MTIIFSERIHLWSAHFSVPYRSEEHAICRILPGQLNTASFLSLREGEE